jgi:predicted amidophosphoribosyltransferase
MQKEKVNAPGGHEVTLAYFTKPPHAREMSLWWLQLKKMGMKPNHVAEAYAKDLPKLAKQFAEQLLADADIAPGLVVVPASAPRQFKPYLDALLGAKADLPVLNGAFTKPEGFQAGDKGRTYEQVLLSTALDAAKLPEGAAAVTRIWIIDDIYNTGNTVGAMTTRLKEHLLALDEIVVVCPLYVPL